MGILTGRQRVTSSPQHAELGKLRHHHDLNDLHKIIKWLDSHNPFESDVVSLPSLSSGISANEDDDINCDNIEEVGYRIQASMDNQGFSDVKLRKKDRVKTLPAALFKDSFMNTTDKSTLANQLLAGLINQLLGAAR